jgi:hypothetical protein
MAARMPISRDNYLLLTFSLTIDRLEYNPILTIELPVVSLCRVAPTDPVFAGW